MDGWMDARVDGLLDEHPGPIGLQDNPMDGGMALMSCMGGRSGRCMGRNG